MEVHLLTTNNCGAGQSRPHSSSSSVLLDASHCYPGELTRSDRVIGSAISCFHIGGSDSGPTCGDFPISSIIFLSLCRHSSSVPLLFSLSVISLSFFFSLSPDDPVAGAMGKTSTRQCLWNFLVARTNCRAMATMLNFYSQNFESQTFQKHKIVMESGKSINFTDFLTFHF